MGPMIGTAVRTRPDPRWTGVASAWFGAMAVLGLAWVWLITATSVDPAESLRIAGSWLVPVGLVGAVLTGPFGLHGPGRRWAVTGLSLAAAVVVAFVVLYNVYD
ncbi:hypothetical protein ASG88_13435 [Nocardioides sp. Soil777]|nr:hypothetical protein ASG88_13435 [Nocardioides sp. Soil777]